MNDTDRVRTPPPTPDQVDEWIAEARRWAASEHNQHARPALVEQLADEVERLRAEVATVELSRSIGDASCRHQRSNTPDPFYVAQESGHAPNPED